MSSNSSIQIGCDPISRCDCFLSVSCCCRRFLFLSVLFVCRICEMNGAQLDWDTCSMMCYAVVIHSETNVYYTRHFGSSDATSCVVTENRRETTVSG